ncbi:Kievitone hydratase [Colletotrichum trifolii]|uniref:Kievitone hydratase n=1 Tax=Colletotrichum trifolii TaxID=5466 RepID=A0A4R8RAG5_COLTR|nr:Kievitone hydratase [Colletotrichum trifolii]
MRIATLVPYLSMGAGYVFRPEDEADFKNPNLPGLFNYTESQFDVAAGSSYWTSSYITGDDGRQYLAINHLLTTYAPTPVCRSSILDLETRDYWVDLTYCLPKNGSGFDNGLPLQADYGTYAFGSKSADSVASMYTYAHTDKSFSFDLEWTLSSRVMLNGGSGIIPFGAVPVNATEWGVPAGRTEGTITIDNKTIAVDPENSFTWYDRQISHGAPKNWTWFELNFPGSAIKASVWAWNLPGDETARFATVRDLDLAQLQHHLPARVEHHVENGDHLSIASIRDDQEMYGSKALVDSAYEGFIEVKGSFFGQEEGFGVVEIVSVF